MKKLTKPEAEKAIKILAKALKYPELKDQHRYLASSNFGELLLSFDLNCTIPTIYTRLRDFSKVINKEECVSRDFGEYSGKRNYHVFPQHIITLIDEFKFDSETILLSETEKAYNQLDTDYKKIIDTHKFVEIEKNKQIIKATL